MCAMSGIDFFWYSVGGFAILMTFIVLAEYINHIRRS